MKNNINCIHAKNPAGSCKNDVIKKGLFGTRVCLPFYDDECQCKQKKEHRRPPPPPSPPDKRIVRENLQLPSRNN